MAARKNLLKRLCQGDVPLVITFWVFYVLAGLALFGMLFAYINSQAGPSHNLAPLAYSIAGASLIVFGYYPLVSMALYRSARNYQGRKLWRIMAMTVAALTIAGAAFSLLWLAVQWMP